jgi:hypothetical protein
VATIVEVHWYFDTEIIAVIATDNYFESAIVQSYVFAAIANVPNPHIDSVGRLLTVFWCLRSPILWFAIHLQWLQLLWVLCWCDSCCLDDAD